MSKSMKKVMKNIQTRHKILLIVGIFMLIIIITSVTFTQYFNSVTLQNEYQNQMMLQMDYAKRNLNVMIDDYQQTISTFLINKTFLEAIETYCIDTSFTDRSDAVKLMNNTISGAISSFKYPPVCSVYIFDHNNNYRYADGVMTDGLEQDMNTSYYLRHNQSIRKQIIWDWRLTVDDNGNLLTTYSLTASLQILKHDDGSPWSIINVSQKMKYICNELANSFDLENGVLYIITSDGATLYSSNPLAPELPGFSVEPTSSYDAFANGYADIKTSEGKKTAFFTAYDKFNWQIIYITNRGYFLNNQIQFTLPYIGFTVLLILLSTAFLFFSSIYLSDRLVKLTKAVQQIDSNHLILVNPVDGNDEVGILSRSFAQIIEMVREALEKNKIIEKEKYKIGLQALQDQIRPHFLYNTLSTISAMAQEIEAYEISDMLYHLADFYRLSLSHGSPQITIKEEIRILTVYVEICRIRFGPSIDIQISVDSSLECCLIPKLIIQPFVENAILHGLDIQLSNNNLINVTVAPYNQDIMISIRDNGVGMNEEQFSAALTDDGGRLHAIGNINRRIKLHFGEPYGVTMISTPGEGALMNILVPNQTAEGSDRT